MATVVKLADRAPVIEQPSPLRLATALPREEFVDRSELLSRLDGARARPLVLLTAPAGYGKTTLLTQWSEQDDRPFAWVRPDSTDGDPAMLVDWIAASLADIGISQPDLGVPKPMLRCERGFVVVIDDADLVDPDALAEAVLWVLDWLPLGAQIAVASRTEPELPLGRMRGHRTLVELGAPDLAMSDAEAAALLDKAGLELEPSVVRELVGRTEGWPVALELAAISYALAPDAAERFEHFAGDDHLMSEYMRAEVLGRLSPAKVRFLARSSVLDELSGPACDAVLERRRSADVLAQLARANVPMRPVDPSHERFRLHGLMREMLQTELRRADPAAGPALHARAADFYSSAHDVDRSIHHALKAEDFDRAGGLLWTNLLGYLGNGRSGLVQEWLDGVPAHRIAACGPLALAAAHCQLARGDVTGAEQSARSAAMAHSRNTAASTERAGSLIIAAWAARSGVKAMAADASRAESMLPDDDPWRASCCFLRGTAALLGGEWAQADRCFDAGAGRGAQLAPDAASLCLAQLAVVATEHRDAELASDYARRARALVDRHGLSSHAGAALVFAVSAAAAVHEGRIDEAKADVSRCLALIAGLPEFVAWYGAEVRILLARVSLTLGDVAGARELLAEASRLARRTTEVVVFERWFDDAWDRFDARAETALIGVASLTTAELRVLRFLPTHYSFQEIAGRLHVSANTVKTHVHAVYRKLDASSRSEAVAHATAAGLLSG
ncbi:MAG: LuxR C-terminal-related transcriptional regulator [Solirubrobacteraceae bacterium]